MPHESREGRVWKSETDPQADLTLSILPAGYPHDIQAVPVYGCPPLPQGFDKQATLDDNDEGMVKRGIIEDPNDTSSAEDGFILPTNQPEQ